MSSLLLATSPVIKLVNLLTPHENPKSKPPSYPLQIAVCLVVLAIARQLYWRFILSPCGWTWDNTETKFVLSCMVAMTHSSLLLPPLLGTLLSHPTRAPSALWSASTPVWNYKTTAVISWCTAYMLQDAFHIVNTAYTPKVGAIGTLNLTSSDIMFLLHHVITTSYMTSIRNLSGGHYSCMLLMFFGEVTNPIHMVFLISEKWAVQLPGTQVAKVLFYSGKAFAVFYAVVRLVLGPVLVVWIIYDLLIKKEGRKNVPVLASTLWCASMVAVLHGSLGYAMDVAKGALMA